MNEFGGICPLPPVLHSSSAEPLRKNPPDAETSSPNHEQAKTQIPRFFIAERNQVLKNIPAGSAIPEGRGGFPSALGQAHPPLRPPQEQASGFLQRQNRLTCHFPSDRGSHQPHRQTGPCRDTTNEVNEVSARYTSPGVTKE